MKQISKRFLEINWKQYFSKLMWRIVIVPSYMPLILLFPLAIVFNLFIWLITGNGRLDEIENRVEKYCTYVWRKVFPID